MSWRLILMLVLRVISVAPTWGDSPGSGYGPSGVIGLLLVILWVLVLTKQIQF